ncbi:NADH:flavin oxidoreductase/NADH oxidase [Chelatococcus reniformis]|uniref:NADH:flavin oxidoreductase / NADH oxidase n=1 Tax=Chelatococcus reniformis TaxID=1494448 RepID=A0A916X8J3_9HYPH|nr:NADH:flavin oxidoreductase/NADH oxidase [Chelatococcus reniformis]GGC50585.1 NADH:flavin oxidoreductase / NADH oxidase [Chelatococcus reniformis]
MSGSQLFSGYRLRDVRLKNRIVASPMWQYRGERGFATDWHLMHLGRLADGGAGLVFQEGTTVERRACGTVGDIGIWDDAFVPQLARIVRLIRANGAVPAIQLMHAGRKARTKRPIDGPGLLERTADIDDWDAWDVVAPSAVPLKEGLAPPREMTAGDVKAVIDAFVAGARRADEAGYDVLELHGAHGYLIHQFLSELTNCRGDRYGGGFDNRIRFLTEIVEGVRSVWPAAKPLMLRLSCIDGAGWTLEHTIKLVERVKALGVDCIDCSSGGLVGSPIPSGQPLDYGYQVPFAAELRRTADIPTAAVGLIVHARQAEDILAAGAADLVLLGRELIYNPNWPIDAAQKLGVDPAFAAQPAHIGLWLGKRASTSPSLVPSTFPQGRASA